MEATCSTAAVLRCNLTRASLSPERRSSAWETPRAAPIPMTLQINRAPRRLYRFCSGSVDASRLTLGRTGWFNGRPQNVGFLRRVVLTSGPMAGKKSMPERYYRAYWGKVGRKLGDSTRGGYPWSTWISRPRQSTIAKAPHIAAAGPRITSRATGQSLNVPAVATMSFRRAVEDAGRSAVNIDGSVWRGRHQRLVLAGPIGRGARD